MPDIKHNFTGGKMNKDVDERLVPNGEYEHAMNIQVSTSEGSEVGAAQNILGNAMQLAKYQSLTIDNNSTCLGSVVDEKNDAFYYFVKSGGPKVDFTAFNSSSPQGANAASKDVIFQYKKEIITPVFVATSAYAYTIYQTGTNISWNSAVGTITLPNQHSVSDLSLNMELIASGFNSSGFPIGVQNMFITNIDLNTNTITLSGDLDWLDNTTASYHQHNTRLFFTNNGSADVNTMLGFVKGNLITGINIVDDMLFWTDGRYDSNGELVGSEPKKINIPRSIAGTLSAFTHTTFLNDTTGLGVPAQEKHITVIKENPKNAPHTALESTKPTVKATMGECEISFEDVANNPGELLVPGDTLMGVPVSHSVTNGLSTTGTANNLDIENGDIMSVELFPDNDINISFPLREPIAQLEVVATYISSVPNSNGVFVTLIDLQIVSISTATPLPPTRYLIDLRLENNERILKFKFPKFAVRYKYQDNEYSAFSPFTQVAFVPLSWDYQPKKGQNIGMQNHLKKVTLSNIVPANIPHGVVQVDILYKESGSSNVYLVDQLKPNDGSGQWNSDQYIIDSELIHAVVAENQMLRHYDNVPKIARAQEVTGSRIVYGNYKQNYTTSAEEANVKFNINLVKHEITQDSATVPPQRLQPHFWNPKLVTPLRSIKSLREYQFGVVFEDKYGRQSPVMTSSQSTLNVPKIESVNTNLLDVKIISNPPDWAESFRFFIKEPSTEYYNLAMDRWYDAEDGNVWLSFPSLDRNKLTEESTIILKKNINSNIAIQDTSEYKVIAISNEVPDFVKSTKVSYGVEDHASNTLLGSAAPVSGAGSLYVDSTALTNGGLGNNGSPLIHAFEDWRDSEMVDKRLWIRFRKTTTPQQTSNWYEVVTMDDYMDNLGTINTDPLLVRIHGQFKDDIDFLSVGGAFVNGAALEIARSVSAPRAAFDGRFFVKILKDLNLEQSILTYEYTTGYSVMGMMTPRFLRYDGYNHQESLMSTLATGSYDIGSLSSKGDYEVFGNSPMSGGWTFSSTDQNPAWWDYNGVSGVGGQNEYKSDESFQDTRWTDTSGIWAYSRNVSTWSHGKSAALNDKPANIFPKAYPYMLGAWHGNYGPGIGVPTVDCIPEYTVSNYAKSWNVHFLGRAEGGPAFNFWDHMGQDDNWFIDMEPTWFFPKKNWVNGVEEYYATPLNFSSGTPTGFNNFDGPSASPDIPTDPNRGHRNTPGVGARLGSRRMDISYVGPDYIPTSSTQPGLDFQFSGNQTTHDFLTSSSAYISFNGDPGMIKYKIVDYRIVEEIGNIPDDSNCTAVETYAMIANDGSLMSYDSTPGLWRVRYELLLDQPIGTTVQDMGIITPDEYILAGGTPDEHHNLDIPFCGNHCCNGVPVYARSYHFFPPSYEAIDDQLNDSFGYPGYNDYSQIGVDNSLSGCYNDHMGITSTPTVQSDVKTTCPSINGAFYDQVGGGMVANTYHTGGTVSIDPNIWKNADDTTRLGYVPTQNRVGAHDVAAGNVTEIPTAGSGAYAATESVEMGMVGWSIFGSAAIGQEEHEASYNPAIWETLPLDPIDLELYYEASNSYPMDLFTNDTNQQIAPMGSGVSCYACSTGTIPSAATISAWGDNNVLFLHPSTPHSNTIITGDTIQLTNLDGSYITVTVAENTTSAYEIKIKPEIYNNNFGLSWHNCFAFGNGVESDRISDTFNSNRIGKGVKVSTILEKDYEEEHRKYGLIYSGLYNSTSGVNNLNQFITAEKITKDINPIYGSIQKLHSRNTDLITLCEDKVLKILANKDAVFNADGNIQLTATGNVLGQTIPFVGEYGISKDPESFASESYRAYFTDRVRGAVMRLSMDGLTPISDHGMKDWFRDSLKKYSGDPDTNYNLVGSYDDRQSEYNLTFRNKPLGTRDQYTVTFREDVKGWVSFKSFVYENALSCANQYYTFNNGYAYQHHLEIDDRGATVPRNQFYGTPSASSISVYLNDFPSVIKSFHTLNYEGSKSRVLTNLLDNEYYNLQDRDGWYVEKIETDKETGTVDEFIEKEGKWFNYIKGADISVNNCGLITNQEYDQASFAMQGLGILEEGPIITALNPGCMDPTAANYDPTATTDDGSCQPFSYGCTEPTAGNYAGANTDDGSCIWLGCTDATAINFTNFPAVAYTYNSGQGITQDPSNPCIPAVYGCMNCGTYWESINTPNYCDGANPAFSTGSFNYNPSANIDTTPTSCVAVQLGCMWNSAFNTSTVSPPANVDPGYCQWYGCTIPSSIYYGLGAQHGPNQGDPWPAEALSYVPYNMGGGYGVIDDGSCIDVGCTDSGTGAFDALGNPVASTYPNYQASNYDPTMNLGNGSCTWDIGCTVSFADDFSPTTPPGSTWENNSTCTISGCMDTLAMNYNCNWTVNPNSPTPCFDGVTYDDNSCVYPSNPGCTDPPADNYDGPNPPFQDDGSCQYCSLDGWSLSNVTSSTVDVTIDPSFSPAPNDATVQYADIRWRVVGTTTWTGLWTINPVDNTAASTHTIMGLTAGTAYEVEVAANCANSISYPNTSQTIATTGLITGCMDGTLNNDGTYAAANYDQFANVAGPCDPYNCPIVTNSFTTNSGYYLYIDIGATAYTPADLTAAISYSTNQQSATSITTSFTQLGSYVWGQNIDLSALMISGDNLVTVTSNTDTSNSSCPSSITSTYTSGCTDPTMCNYNSLAVVEAGFCVDGTTNLLGWECQNAGNSCVGVYGCTGGAGLYPPNTSGQTACDSYCTQP